MVLGITALIPDQGMLCPVSSLGAGSGRSSSSSAVFWVAPIPVLLLRAAPVCCTDGFTTGCSLYGSFLLVSLVISSGDHTCAAASQPRFPLAAAAPCGCAAEPWPHNHQGGWDFLVGLSQECAGALEVASSLGCDNCPETLKLENLGPALPGWNVDEW